MLSSIRLLFNLDRIIDALKAHVGHIQLTHCWVGSRYKTVQVTAHLDDSPIHTWGVDENESLAIGKALMELIERIHIRQKPHVWTNSATGKVESHQALLAQYSVLDDFLATSSGMAAHLSRKRAASAATLELIERHVLTKAVLEGISPQMRIGNSFFWEGPNSTYVSMAFEIIKDGGVIYASGAGRSKAEASESAQRELSGMSQWSRNPANISQLLATQRTGTPNEIQAFYLRQQSPLAFLNTLTNMPSFHERQAIWTAEIPKLPAFQSIPGLSVVRAFCPHMQPFYFGKLMNGPINPLAISIDNLNPQAEYNVVA